MPKAVDKEPKIPTLSKLAHVHTRISKGFAPYTAIDEEKELEGMEEHRVDLVALAADDSEAMSPALKTGVSVKKENETGSKKSSIPAVFTPTRKNRYSASPTTSSVTNKSNKVSSATKIVSKMPTTSGTRSTGVTSKPSIPSSKIVKSRQIGTSKDKTSAYLGHTVQYNQKVS